MRQALHAEWTKLRTVPGPAQLLAGAVVLTIALGTIVAASASYDNGLQDTAKLSLTGIELGQAVVALLAVTMVAGEYGTGMIRLSLTAVPRRLHLLAAKGLLTGALVLVTGAVAVLASMLVSRFIFLDHGFTRAHGYAALSLLHGSTLRAAGGAVLYLGLVALFGIGLAAVVRDTATSIGVVLGVLYVLPVVQSFVSSPQWQRHLEQISPMTAGLEILDTVNLRGLPLTPWSGLGVLALWAAGALVGGWLVLRLRDA